MIPAAEHYGLGIIPWSPLQGGLLGGVIRKQNEGVRRLEGRSARRSRTTVTRSRRTRTWRPSWATSPASWAWPGCSAPAVTAPIIGPRTAEQLDGALRAVELDARAATLDRLDEIFPGHKTAPEDYAW